MSWNVATAGHHHIWLLALIVTGPVPDPQAFRAMDDSFFHVEELEMILLVGHDNVDIVDAMQTVIHHREQRVSVRWQVNSNNLWTLVCDDIKESRVLMGEAIMVLTPHGGSKQDIQRRHFGSPFDFETLLNSFAVLVNHRVDDVDERFVAIQQSMPPR